MSPEVIAAPAQSQASRGILWAGLVAGSMDIIAGFVVYGHYGVKPMRLLQGIASGLLGSRSFSGGATTAAFGLVCHFFIAFSAAAVYFWVSRGAPFLVDRAVISGVVYGPIVYFFMQLVVLPMSASARRPFSLKMTIIGIVVHIICIGLPIALLIRRSSIG